MLYSQVNTTQDDLILFIVTTNCPGCPCEGGCEFCHGPCTSNHIEQLDISTMKIHTVHIDLAKELYKKVIGRNDRISYWSVLKEMQDGWK